MEWNTQIINRNVKNKITVNFVLFYIKNHDFCETDVSRFNSLILIDWLNVICFSAFCKITIETKYKWNTENTI